MNEKLAQKLHISDIGEKQLIKEFVRPLFNKQNAFNGVGDDCAMLDDGCNNLWLFSTDRVPADLVAFRLGILNYHGLGRYLACLNISDISACGGRPLALLLNLGLPPTLYYDDFKELCLGFGIAAEKNDCQVLGGDITSSAEISLSATSIGKVDKDRVLTRRGASIGDTIFISRPLGLTPTAFGYYLGEKRSPLILVESDIDVLNAQFTSLDPLVSLGLELASSGRCTSCMDNTDGIGQSLLELSIESGCAFVVSQNDLNILDIVSRVAKSLDQNPISLAFSAGADFSLVGTLKGPWTSLDAKKRFGSNIEVIGYVEDGEGIFIENNNERKPLQFTGWNYFSEATQKNAHKNKLPSPI